MTRLSHVVKASVGDFNPPLILISVNITLTLSYSRSLSLGYLKHNGALSCGTVYLARLEAKRRLVSIDFNVKCKDLHEIVYI